MNSTNLHQGNLQFHSSPSPMDIDFNEEIAEPIYIEQDSSFGYNPKLESCSIYQSPHLNCLSNPEIDPYFQPNSLLLAPSPIPALPPCVTEAIVLSTSPLKLGAVPALPVEETPPPFITPAIVFPTPLAQFEAAIPALPVEEEKQALPPPQKHTCPAFNQTLESVKKACAWVTQTKRRLSRTEITKHKFSLSKLFERQLTKLTTLNILEFRTELQELVLKILKIVKNCYESIRRPRNPTETYKKQENLSLTWPTGDPPSDPLGLGLYWKGRTTAPLPYHEQFHFRAFTRILSQNKGSITQLCGPDYSKNVCLWASSHMNFYQLQ